MARDHGQSQCPKTSRSRCVTCRDPRETACCACIVHYNDYQCTPNYHNNHKEGRRAGGGISRSGAGVAGRFVTALRKRVYMRDLRVVSDFLSWVSLPIRLLDFISPSSSVLQSIVSFTSFFVCNRYHL